MNEDLLLRALTPPDGQRLYTGPDGSQTWTTMWTLTVTRVPVPVPGPLAQPFVGEPGTAVTEPVVVRHMGSPYDAPMGALPALPAAPASYDSDALVQIPGRWPDRLPSRREIRRSERPRAARRAETPKTAHAPKPPAPAFLRVSLGLAIGVGLIVAGVRADTMDQLGLNPPDTHALVGGAQKLVVDMVGSR